MYSTRLYAEAMEMEIMGVIASSITKQLVYCHMWMRLTQDDNSCTVTSIALSINVWRYSCLVHIRLV